MVETRCNLKKQSKNVITKRQKRFLHIYNTKKFLEGDVKCWERKEVRRKERRKVNRCKFES